MEMLDTYSYEKVKMNSNGFLFSLLGMINLLYLRSRLGMLLPEKYESIFDVSSEGPSSGSLVNFPCLLPLFTKLPDEGPSLETSKILSYFSGRSIPNLLRRYLRSLYLHWQLLFMINLLQFFDLNHSP